MPKPCTGFSGTYSVQPTDMIIYWWSLLVETGKTRMINFFLKKHIFIFFGTINAVIKKSAYF